MMAHRLSMNVVAEGVETMKQLGCGRSAVNRFRAICFRPQRQLTKQRY
ncbi:MAG: hypothetical protein KME15_13000 [Drouetiella hepatica Uher 2000/2452]|uniref:EAL domain-containing protein n=1 Tax=Drouetiella hepatica Uher 2000/2452 TaxID=904376 RepID=A0A951UMC9_9CYAN|nr:hypothetical protein [Drouetiella hepatica Uher 2000/2452]